MYSWKSIRLVCIILLLLPVVHFFYLVSRDTLNALNPDPAVWQPELDAYIRQDAREQLPAEPLVVVGGRRVQLWNGLEAALAPQPVLMRELGDAIVEDIIFHYHRLIAFYRPRAVVLLPGGAEFALRDAKSGRELAAAVGDLVALDRHYRPAGQFYLIVPLKTPLWPQYDATIDTAAALLTELAADDERLIVLDPNPLLAGRDGSPDPRLFRTDGILLNEHGYLRLTEQLRRSLRANGTLTTRADSVHFTEPAKAH